MNDQEIEDVLRRYRPAGPPRDFRARILRDAAPDGRTWPWVAAAAVLLATTLSLHIAADQLTGSAAVGVAADPNEEAITLLTEWLGDRPSAREVAEAVVTLDTTPGQIVGPSASAVQRPND
jgi:hypothetical protein